MPWRGLITHRTQSTARELVCACLRLSACETRAIPDNAFGLYSARYAGFHHTLG